MFIFLPAHITDTVARHASDHEHRHGKHAGRRARLPLPYATDRLLVVATVHSTHTRPFRIRDRQPLAALTATSRYKNAISPRASHYARYTLVHSEWSAFKLHALAHISQLQLKASLSLHCVTNRGLPFLFEIVVGKTALHKRQGSMYDQSHCCELARFDSRQTGE